MVAIATDPGLDRLARTVRSVTGRRLRPGTTAEQVAAALRPLLAVEDLLAPEHTTGDPASYRSHILHVEPDGSFSVVALVWLPGQVTPIHDHISWCVVGVYRGYEHEVRYRRAVEGGRRCLVETGRTVNGPGSVSFLVPPGDIHLVRNPTGRKVISLHVYGADIGQLGSSIRRRYDLPVLPSTPA